jgi:hypothetical protein
VLFAVGGAAVEVVRCEVVEEEKVHARGACYLGIRSTREKRRGLCLKDEVGALLGGGA